MSDKIETVRILTSIQINVYETAFWGCRLAVQRSMRLSPGPNAAKFRTIMIRAKRYIPIVTPIPMCIAQMQTNQIFRVWLFQIKNGYVISKRQTTIPATGNT